MSGRSDNMTDAKDDKYSSFTLALSNQAGDTFPYFFGRTQLVQYSFTNRVGTEGASFL